MIQDTPYTPLDQQTSLAPDKVGQETSQWQAPVMVLAGLSAVYLLRRQIFRPRTLWLLAGVGAARLVPQLSASMRGIPLRGLVKAQATMTINRSAEELYTMWADVESSPKWMERVKSVERTGERMSHWVLSLPTGVELTWDSEMTAMEPGRRLAWKSTPGALVPQAGQVLFERAENGRGTIVRVSQEFLLPGGALGSALGALFARTPGGFVRENLRHFKQLAETGEIPTTKGQPHGSRNWSARVKQLTFGEHNQKEGASMSGATQNRTGKQDEDMAPQRQSA